MLEEFKDDYYRITGTKFSLGVPMKQLTFSDMEYFNRKKKTKREEFLDAMEKIIL